MPAAHLPQLTASHLAFPFIFTPQAAASPALAGPNPVTPLPPHLRTFSTHLIPIA